MTAGKQRIHETTVFFDLGWTLEDETEAQRDRARRTASCLTHYGIVSTPGDILRLQEEGARKYAPSVYLYALERLGVPACDVETVITLNKWDTTYLSLYPAVLHVLERLSTTCTLGIIANQSPGSERRVTGYGIRDYFTVYCPSAEVNMAKPESAFYRYAWSKTNSAASATWMIGDRIDNDIIPAKKLGWHTIRVLNGYNALQEPRTEEETPEFTVRRLEDVVDIIQKETSSP